MLIKLSRICTSKHRRENGCRLNIKEECLNVIVLMELVQHRDN